MTLRGERERKQKSSNQVVLSASDTASTNSFQTPNSEGNQLSEESSASKDTQNGFVFSQFLLFHSEELKQHKEKRTRLFARGKHKQNRRTAVKIPLA